MYLKTTPCLTWFLASLLIVAVPDGRADDGVFVRFRLNEPTGANFYVKLGGTIHQPNWSLAPAIIPADAERANHARVPAGQFTDWFDLGKHAGANLHGRMNL